MILSLKKLKPFLWSDLKVTSVSCHKRVTATHQDIFMKVKKNACALVIRIAALPVFSKKNWDSSRDILATTPGTQFYLSREMRINPMCVLFSSSVIFVNLIKAFIYKKLYSILKIHHCQCFILCIIILTFSLLRFSLIDCKLFAVILTPVWNSRAKWFSW